MLMYRQLTQRRCGLLCIVSGKDAGKTTVIVRALCGLKSAGAAFRSHLANCIELLGYQSYKIDPDLWLKPEIRPEDGVKYYSYLLC